MCVICFSSWVFSLKHRVTNAARGLNGIADFFFIFSEGINLQFLISLLKNTQSWVRWRAGTRLTGCVQNEPEHLICGEYRQLIQL